MDPSKVQVILGWSSPRNVKDIQSFIGFANFYRRFIPNFSAKVSPITQLLKKGWKFEWLEEAEDAFQFLKRASVTAPILMHPDQAFFVETDA